MKWKITINTIRQIADQNAFRWLKNRYILSGIAFVIWMLFLDTHSLKIHYKLFKEIQQARKAISFFSSEIEKDRELIKQLESDPVMLERFAREHYYFKKPNEQIFIIETEQQ